MTPECIHTLRNGRKCRGLAGHQQPFCRHHRPKIAGVRPVSRGDRYSPLARWRAVGRELPYLRADELSSLVYNLLDALTQPGQAPSDRTVGCFLRAALTRLGQVPFPYPDESTSPQPLTTAAAHPTPSAQFTQPTRPASPSASTAFPSANPADVAALPRELAALLASLEQPR